MNFTDEERFFILGTKNNIDYFNANRRKGKLDVKYYVADGNKADVTKDGKVILSGVSIREAFYGVTAIINYEER